MLIGDRPDEDRLNVVLRLRDTPVSIAIGQIALDVAVVEVRAASRPYSSPLRDEATARTRERIDIPAPIGWILVAAGAGLLLTGAYVKNK